MFEQENLVSGIKKYIDDEIAEVFDSINHKLNQVNRKLYENEVTDYAITMFRLHEKLRNLREIKNKINELERKN